MVDKIDSKIILELQKDGRRSYYELAKELGLSVATVARRISNLVNDVITIQVVPVQYLTNKQVKILLVINADMNKIDEICDKMSTYSGINLLQTVFGRYDIVARATFFSVTELNDFARDLSQIEGIKRSWICIINEIKKTWNSILLSEAVMAHKFSEIDETDRRIIAELERNGRSSYKNLAKKLGASSSTIARRFKNLYDSGLIKVTAVPKMKKGELPDAIILVNAEASKISEICERLVGYSNVYNVETCLGLFDIVIGIQSVSQKELYSFIKNELMNMPGVKNTETVFVGEFKKT